MIFKLRAWDKINQKMLYRTLFDTNWYATEKNDKKGCHLVREIKQSDHNNLVIMQAAKLKDKNKKNVYEGDVVVCNNKKWEVVFNSCFFGFTVEDKYGRLMLCDAVRVTIEDGSNAPRTSILEIIGNIYENEDLKNQVR